MDGIQGSKSWKAQPLHEAKKKRLSVLLAALAGSLEGIARSRGSCISEIGGAAFPCGPRRLPSPPFRLSRAVNKRDA